MQTKLFLTGKVMFLLHFTVEVSDLDEFTSLRLTSESQQHAKYTQLYIQCNSNQLSYWGHFFLSGCRCRLGLRIFTTL